MHTQTFQVIKDLLAHTDIPGDEGFVYTQTFQVKKDLLAHTDIPDDEGFVYTQTVQMMKDLLAHTAIPPNRSLWHYSSISSKLLPLASGKLNFHVRHSRQCCDMRSIFGTWTVTTLSDILRTRN